MKDPDPAAADRPTRRQLLGITAAAAVAASSAAAGMPPAATAEGLRVEVATKPGKPFVARLTRSLEDFPDLPPDAPLDRFGGLATRQERGTGFFRTQRIDGRWWLIDPDGSRFISRGVNSVTPTATASARKAFGEKFGSEVCWARETSALLRSAGFNTVGAWSDSDALQAVHPPLARTPLWSFMASYGKKRGGTTMQAGHVGYPNDCPFIFDPAFPKFCEEHARQLGVERESPSVIGHFSDNEMPWKRGLLEKYLELPETDPGHAAARSWLDKRHGRKEGSGTDRDRRDFLEFVLDRYLSIVAAAVRKHAPDQLFLGPRLHEIAFELPEVFRACGRHCDIVCVNYYRAWNPDPQQIAMWGRESGRPFMVTEHYAKGVDSGMGNTSGAGWLVKTQQDRGRFYQNFGIGLLESRHCVGWYWHRYADNDPEDTKVDPSNRDSNKGLVTAEYEPWRGLLAEMRPFNQRVHGIIDALDTGAGSRGKKSR